MKTEIINTCKELLKDSENIDKVRNIINDNYEDGEELEIAQLYDEASFYDDALEWLMEANSEECTSVILQWAKEAETNEKKLAAVASSDEFLDALAEIDTSRLGTLAKVLVNADMDELAKEYCLTWMEESSDLEEQVEFLKFLLDNDKTELLISILDDSYDDEFWEHLDSSEKKRIVEKLESKGLYEEALEIITHSNTGQEELLDWWFEDINRNAKKQQVTSDNYDVESIIGELLNFDPKYHSSISEFPHYESWTIASYYCKFYDTTLELLAGADGLGDHYLVENLILIAIEDENEEFVKSIVERVLCENGIISFDEYLTHPTINDYVLARLLYYQGKAKDALTLFGRVANSKNEYKEEAVEFIAENYSEEDAAHVLKHKRSKATTDKPRTDNTGTKSGVGRSGRKKKTFFQKAMNTIKKMF